MSTFNEKLSAAYQKAVEAKSASIEVVIAAGLDVQERTIRLNAVEEAYNAFLGVLIQFDWERTAEEQKEAEDYLALMREHVVEEEDEDEGLE